MKAKIQKLLKKFAKIFCISENVLHFIGSGEVLPMPFTAEQENDMLEKLCSGEKEIKDCKAGLPDGYCS